MEEERKLDQMKPQYCHLPVTVWVIKPKRITQIGALHFIFTVYGICLFECPLNKNVSLFLGSETKLILLRSETAGFNPGSPSCNICSPNVPIMVRITFRYTSK